MRASDIRESDRSASEARVATALWPLVAITVAANLASAFFPRALPIEIEAGVLIGLPFAFAFAHGFADGRLGDTLVFAAICLVVANAFENLGVLTGFPFGRYHFTGSLGPKLFQVPLVIGPAYFGMGYLSWMLARAILNADVGGEPGRSLIGLPALASVILVSWDLSLDPLASTLRQAWIWHDGGGYFGVPVSNFFGWYLTAYAFFQLHALYLRWRAPSPARRAMRPRSFWLQPIALYGVTAARLIVVSTVSAASAATVTDAAGTVWRVHDICVTCAFACAFTMGAFTILAVARIMDGPSGRAPTE